MTTAARMMAPPMIVVPATVSPNAHQTQMGANTTSVMEIRINSADRKYREPAV